MRWGRGCALSSEREDAPDVEVVGAVELGRPSRVRAARHRDDRQASERVPYPGSRHRLVATAGSTTGGRGRWRLFVRRRGAGVHAGPGHPAAPCQLPEPRSLLVLTEKANSSDTEARSVSSNVHRSLNATLHRSFDMTARGCPRTRRRGVSRWRGAARSGRPTSPSGGVPRRRRSGCCGGTAARPHRAACSPSRRRPRAAPSPACRG